MRSRASAWLLFFGLWSGAVGAQDAAPAVSSDSLAVLLRTGEAAWEAGEYPQAFAAYDAIVRADSAFSTRALFRVGLLHAWSERHASAIACHRLYIVLEPRDLEGRVALGRTLSWAGRYAEAIAQYDSVLAQDPGYRDAGLGKATVFAWTGRLTEAIDEAEIWRRHLPNDQDPALARAQFLSWAGRLDEALALYDSLAATGDVREAQKGRARVLAWRGDLDLSESRWREYVSDHPDDASGWTGLAQVLRWMGRPFAASEALQRAVAVSPNDRDAREQMRWVRSEIRPQAGMTSILATDSEDNTMLRVETTGALALRGNVRVTGVARSTRVGAAFAATDASSTSATAGLQWQPRGTAWTLRGEVGVVEFPEVSTAGVVRTRFSVRAGGRLGTRWRVGAGVGREPFDEVLSSLDAAVSYNSADVDLSYALRPQLTVGAAGSVGSASGRGVETDRTTVVGAMRWTISRGLRAALTHREAAWTEPAYGIFFAPQRFALTEASVGWERPRELGLIAAADLGVGSQAVRFESTPTSGKLAMRGALRLGWRPIPGREVIAALVYANVAGAGAITASEYSYGAITLGGRWTF